LPIELRKELYNGVVYYRRVHYTPYPMIAHIVTVDTTQKNISFLVTPGDKNNPLPLKARTTSQFLREFNVQIAVNGDGFTPWYSYNPLVYYPHSGQRVKPNGYAASKGTIYSDKEKTPTLFISKGNQLSFSRPNDVYNAISGDRMLVRNGKPVKGLDDVTPAPRTAIGIDNSGDKLIIIVVDGRQPLYSSGATLKELADYLVMYGAETAMNLDGGGSSTLVFAGFLGTANVVNSPIHTRIPGWERPVGNHLGIFVK
jgi:exopolysaccharide biosynthesis protein